MDPLQIALIVLAIAGVWAVVELALTLRRARSSVDALDRTLESVNATVAEARPVIAKLDGAIDDIQPALGQVEPLLKQGSIAVEALSADLIEVNGVLRDVSSVTGSVSTASGAVTGIANAASEKVQRLFAKHHDEPAAGSRALSDRAGDAAVTGEGDAAPDDEAVPPVAEADEPKRRYYTYSDETVSTDQESSDE